MTKAKATRLNARLPPELARKAAYLERRLALSTTEVIHTALERLYDEVCSESPEAGAAGLAGFIGCAEGAPDLSSNYKSELTSSLQDKG